MFYKKEERKNGDRTDFADRDFDLSIPADAINGTTISLSSTSDLAPGDVIVQEQYFTISEYNRLLLKLDIDPGLDDVDYFSSLEMTIGDDITNKTTELNTKLIADDSSGTITSQIFSTDFVTLQTQVNAMIVELNDPASDTLFTDYKDSVGVKPYEAIILDKSFLNNDVTVSIETCFIVGDIVAYKGIDTATQWAPQHFSASDVLKQVREGTVIFDQNNFYGGTIAYSSDRSANFEEVEFVTKALGPGTWGGNIWGQGVWGGNGNEVPQRTLVPRDKQRCRHIKVRFEHVNAREIFRILGISLEPRALSKRAYR
jgi:hypothetical protein